MQTMNERNLKNLDTSKSASVKHFLILQTTYALNFSCSLRAKDIDIHLYDTYTKLVALLFFYGHNSLVIQNEDSENVCYNQVSAQVKQVEFF